MAILCVCVCVFVDLCIYLSVTTFPGRCCLSKGLKLQKLDNILLRGTDVVHLILGFLKQKCSTGGDMGVLGGDMGVLGDKMGVLGSEMGSTEGDMGVLGSDMGVLG